MGFAKNEKPSSKFDSPWVGPFKVLERPASNMLKLDVVGLRHIDQIKVAHLPPGFGQAQPTASSSASDATPSPPYHASAETTRDREYEVETILGHDDSDPTETWYVVKWVGSNELTCLPAYLIRKSTRAYHSSKSAKKVLMKTRTDGTVYLTASQERSLL